MPQFTLSPDAATHDQQLSAAEAATARWLLESHREARLDQVAALALLPAEYAVPRESVEGRDATSRDRLLQAASAVLGEIESAIRRLDEDTYGRCVTCGAGIATERLLREPHVAHCSACAANR